MIISPYPRPYTSRLLNGSITFLLLYHRSLSIIFPGFLKLLSNFPICPCVPVLFRFLGGLHTSHACPTQQVPFTLISEVSRSTTMRKYLCSQRIFGDREDAGRRFSLPLKPVKANNSIRERNEVSVVFFRTFVIVLDGLS
jgi:hypothetical protein